MFFLYYFALMIRFSSILVFSIFLYLNVLAQTEIVPSAKHTTKENREKEYRNLINIINKNLSVPLSDTTEEDWLSAFSAMELILYRSSWTDERIRLAFTSIDTRTVGFQRAALELIYTLKLNGLTGSVNKLLKLSANAKIFAMCAEYLLLLENSPATLSKINKLLYPTIQSTTDKKDGAILMSLNNRITEYRLNKNKFTSLHELFEPNFLKGNTVVYSIQRKNRNYPGIVIVKDSSGFFVTDNSGNIFSVPQLARSITNLPGYLTNGNTPQGIFRMDGFAVSKIAFIGPTENIQLSMPEETSVKHFLKDSLNTETSWSIELYKSLLPDKLKNYEPLFETYRAGMAGRTEIIAHGTTVNPAYYKNKPYYPFTPTEGCLATKEIWSAVDGKRIESDQQKLVDAVKKAGGANGYYIVLEIDDQQRQVYIDDTLPLLNKKIK